jgi:hypothetical protein
MQKVFEKACHNGDTETVKMMLAYPGVDPTIDDCAALFWAAGHNDVAMARVLLADPRVRACKRGCIEAIKWASFIGRWEVVQAMLEDPIMNLSTVVQQCTKTLLVRLITDIRWGFHANRAVYETYQSNAADWYLEQYNQAVSQGFAMAFVASQLIPWTDLVEPLVDRLKASIGFDDDDENATSSAKRIKKSH